VPNIEIITTSFLFIVSLIKPKLHLFDLLWICCTTNSQHLDMSRCCEFVVQFSICCGFVVQLVVQQIHNILTCQDVVDLLYSKSETNRTSGV